MAETEKVTVNLSVVDLGQIDLLVEQGLYSSRTDLIRTAIRNQLRQHDDVVQQTIVRRALVMGVVVYTRSGLEKARAKGERLEIRVVGMLVIQDDVPAALARETIESIKVHGVLKASDQVRRALADRIE